MHTIPGLSRRLKINKLNAYTFIPVSILEFSEYKNNHKIEISESFMFFLRSNYKIR